LKFDAEEAVDSVDWVDEEPPGCCCSWNSWFTKAELGYDMDAGIEVGIGGTV
jgi:hypothetical protein